MAYFPLFISLDHLPCLVVGGGKVALRKVKTLLEYGAKVTVTAPELDAELEKIPGIIIRKRKFTESDLDGMELVFAATTDEECNKKVSKLCKEKRILINVADVPEECDFYFPALVRRGDVVVGVSTGGKSPAAAKKIKEKIDTCLPDSLSDFIEETGELRAAVLDSGQKPEENREYNKKVEDYFREMGV
ncbi:MAG: bifunctional precorrin-2 dehydrogenase/sirohydrochlorin ferrochelatase [Lachnospiraceae bacterium]